jgi:hypothetical protein
MTTNTYAINKFENSEFLNETYTGSGKMSVRKTLEKILPADIELIAIDTNLEKIISWEFNNQKRKSILNQLGKEVNFTWEKIDYRILINKGESLQEVNRSKEKSETARSSETTFRNLETSSSPKIDQQIDTKKPKGRFEIKSEDETLSITFKRWSTQEGYQLVWDADKDFPTFETIYDQTNFEDTIYQVMSDIENSDYPLHACMYKNKVLRIIPMSKNCERQKEKMHE